ncbi:NUDIX hydrolase [Chloroflexota bacterium]
MLARYKAQVSQLFQKFPLLGRLGIRVYRLGQARYTAGAVAIVFNEAGAILLLKHVYRQKYLWGLPGGWVDRKENPGETVRRELMEETGLRIVVMAPVWIGQGVWSDHLDMAYICQLEGGDLSLSGEILDYRWVQPAELPKMLDFQTDAIAQALRLREAFGWQ